MKTKNKGGSHGLTSYIAEQTQWVRSPSGLGLKVRASQPAALLGGGGPAPSGELTVRAAAGGVGAVVVGLSLEGFHGKAREWGEPSRNGELLWFFSFSQ